MSAPDTTPREDVAKLLLIEDDRQAAEYLRKGLSEHGHVVDHAADGREGLFMATGAVYDALIVDRMLPGLDGLSVLTALRAAGDRTPTLILSALGTVDDRVRGLRTGGDDYLVKPYAFAELLARLEALLRRGATAGTVETKLRVGDLEMDLLTRTVQRGGQPIDLLPREFKLLEFFLRHKEQVVTRTMLLEGVWDYRYDPHTNIIDTHISRLRKKIEEGFDGTILHTVRGVGYRLSRQA